KGRQGNDLGPQWLPEAGHQRNPTACATGLTPAAVLCDLCVSAVKNTTSHGLRYSDRKAVTGPTPAARHAGRADATTDVALSRTTTPTNVTGSLREIPNRSVASICVVSVAATTPATTPSAVSRSPCRRTSLTMSARVAPNAERTPISRQRSTTLP